MNENSDPVVLQEFVSEYGLHLASLPTYPCDDFDKTGERYMLRSDIQHTFASIDYLEDGDREGALYMVDHDFKL
ncbi:hypothetical protein BGZ82_003719, partial [Podila clonocystis]